MSVIQRPSVYLQLKEFPHSWTGTESLVRKRWTGDTWKSTDGENDEKQSQEKTDLEEVLSY